MKNKIDITSSISLDEIKYELQTNLDVEDLVKFALELADKLSDEEDFYKLLHKKLTKILKCYEKR